MPWTVGPKLMLLPESNQILKIGPGIEAEAMRLVHKETSVPVPKVYDVCEKE